jgi:hypothetical protein
VLRAAMALLPLKQLIAAAVDLHLRKTVRGIVIATFGLIFALLGTLFPEPFDIAFMLIGLFATVAGFFGAIFARE